MVDSIEHVVIVADIHSAREHGETGEHLVPHHRYWKYTDRGETRRSASSYFIFYFSVYFCVIDIDQNGKESRKKIIFTAATSLSVVLFGILVF